MFQRKVVEKINTHISSATTFSENRALYEIMRKNIAARQATEGSIIRRRKM
jgi:hypothetical protein